MKERLWGHDIEIEIERTSAGPWDGFDLSYKGAPIAFTHFCETGQTEEWRNAEVHKLFMHDKQAKILLKCLKEALHERA